MEHLELDEVIGRIGTLQSVINGIYFGQQELQKVKDVTVQEQLQKVIDKEQWVKDTLELFGDITIAQAINHCTYFTNGIMHSKNKKLEEMNVKTLKDVNMTIL